MASKNGMEKYHMGAANKMASVQQRIRAWHLKARSGGRGKLLAKKEDEES